jgi:hypothetical protein
MRIKSDFAPAIILCAALVASSCGGGGSSPINNPPPGFSIQLAASTLMVTQDGTAAAVDVALTRSAGNTNSVTLSIAALPTGATTQITSPGTGNKGTIAFNGQGAAAGTYQVTVNATDGATNASASLKLIVAIVSVVQNSINTSVGVNGRLQEFMSTSFQPAEWDYQFFINHPDITPLTTLGPQHIRIQGLSQAVPMKANSSPQQPTDWDFTMLDAVVQPILGAADHSPEFQIAVAPSFMNDSSGHLDITHHLADFVEYSANLVRYYNTGGFTWGGKHFQSASPNKITWWGIFNEYNINGLNPTQYVQLYNAVVPAMLAVDPTIQISALELADYDFDVGDPRNNLPTFVLPANQGGVNAQVNIVSTHFYSSCNQKDPDTQLFNSVASFTNDVSYIYQELKLRPDLANIPVWVTENNVNADFDANGSGISACNGTKFVTDPRGTSASFAAWRPYVFSQLGRAGNQALYHWTFDADPQYGEVDFNTAKTYLSYWVDYYLEKYLGSYSYCPPLAAVSPLPEFPVTCPLPPSSILNVNSTETSTVEVLATINLASQAVVMIANHAVHSPSDNNGPGDPRTVIVDLSTFICTSGGSIPAQLLTIDATTDPSTGPTSVPVTASPRATVTLNGYGVAFLVFSTCGSNGCVCPA